METFIISCPHCAAKLSVEKEWIGMEVQCPSCSKQIQIDSPEEELAEFPAPEPELPLIEKNGKKTAYKKTAFPYKSKYIFGRLYIILSWLFALLCILYGAWTCSQLYSNYAYQKSQLVHSEEDTKKILELQKLVSEEYISMITSLMEKKNNSGSSEITGIRIPEQLANPNIVFDDILNTSERISFSLNTTNTLKNQLTDVQKLFRGPFNKVITQLEDEIRQKERDLASRDSSSSSSLTRTSSIVVKVDKQVDFYTSIANPQKVEYLKLLKTWIPKIQDYNGVHSMMKSELNQLNRYADFIKNHLLNQRIINTKGGLSGIDVSETEENKNPADARKREELKRLKDARNFFMTLRDNFASDWKVASTLPKLTYHLEARLIQQKKFDDQHSKLLKDLCNDILKTVFICLFIAFMQLVLADFLRAHFDSSEAVQKIKEEKDV